MASSPFKARQLFGHGPTAYLRREVASSRTDGSKRDEEATH